MRSKSTPSFSYGSTELGVDLPFSCRHFSHASAERKVTESVSATVQRLHGLHMQRLLKFPHGKRFKTCGERSFLSRRGTVRSELCCELATVIWFSVALRVVVIAESVRLKFMWSCRFSIC